MRELNNYRRFSSITGKFGKRIGNNRGDISPSVPDARMASRRTRNRKEDQSGLFTPGTSVKSGRGLYLNLSTLLRGSSFSIESSVIEEYIQRAITLSREGMFSVREYIQILHLFSRSTNVLEVDSVIHLSQFIGIIESNLRINNSLKNSMTVIDVAVGLNSVAKIKKCPKTNPIRSVLGQLHDQLIGQVCVRMSMFEDHHLAQILHSIAILNRPSAVNVGKSIFRELCDNRDVSAFNLQALVMLASSISRIVSWPTINEDHHVVQNSQKIWQEIMRGVLKSNKEQFQPKWPDVFLTSFAFFLSRPLSKSRGKISNSLD